MRQDISTFGNIEIEKTKFYRHETRIFLRDVDTEKVLVPKKISLVKKNNKYFISYLYNNHKVQHFHIMLPETSAYLKRYVGQTKWMYFLIEDDDLLENNIWIKSVLIYKNNLIACLFIIKNFWKPK